MSGREPAVCDHLRLWPQIKPLAGNIPAGRIADLSMRWNRSDKASGDAEPVGADFPVDLTEAQWRERLSPEEFAVLRKGDTEAPWAGEYVDDHTEGVYRCRACDAELFRSAEKFDSHCGWPSFFSPLAGDAVVEKVDRSFGMTRTEVLCANCGSHLGHVFAGEGYNTPTDLRYCINSISLRRD